MYRMLTNERSFYGELVGNSMTSYMVFCPSDCAQKAADGIVNKKCVEHSVKKYMVKIYNRLDRLEKEKTEKTK